MNDGDTIIDGEAAARLAELKQVADSPGWAVVVARFDAEMQALEMQILDPQSNDAEVAVLRRVRARLLEIHPVAAMKTLRGKYAALLRKG